MNPCASKLGSKTWQNRTAASRRTMLLDADQCQIGFFLVVTMMKKQNIIAKTWQVAVISDRVLSYTQTLLRSMKLRYDIKAVVLSRMLPTILANLLWQASNAAVRPIRYRRLKLPALWKVGP
mgnify:CR=1 FL=1